MELELLIKRIAREILEEIAAQRADASEGTLSGGDTKGRILVMVPENSINTGLHLKYIRKMNEGFTLEVASSFEEKTFEGCRFIDLKKAEERHCLTGALSNYTKIYCVSPGLKFMSLLSDLDYNDFIAEVLTAGALRGIETFMLLDYSLSGVTSKELAEKVRALVDSINSKGIRVVSIVEKEEEIPPAVLRELITAEDIDSMWNSGNRTINYHKGIVITPLAVDRARELGMRLRQID